MSPNCKVVDKDLQCFPTSVDVSVDEIVAFVGNRASVAFGRSGVLLVFDDGECVAVEDGDVLVRIFGELEVFTAETFNEYFQ